MKVLLGRNTRFPTRVPAKPRSERIQAKNMPIALRPHIGDLTLLVWTRNAPLPGRQGSAEVFLQLRGRVSYPRPTGDCFSLRENCYSLFRLTRDAYYEGEC